jgi:hypothetical protein
MELPKPQQIIKNILFFNEIKFYSCKAQRMITWDAELYNEFLNSIFKNIPTGQIILNYISETNCYEIIDGQHRINVIQSFIMNKIPFKVDNKLIYYKDLNDSDKDIFDSTVLFVVIYSDLDEKQIITLYLTINSGIDQDENHITNLINSTQKYQDLIDKIKDKYPDVDRLLFLKIINIVAFIVNEYEKFGEHSVKFKQLSKVHFKIIVDEINKKYGTEEIKQLLIKVSKIIDIIFTKLKNYTFTNNIYVFLCHRLYLDLNPNFICTDATIYNNFLIKV